MGAVVKGTTASGVINLPAKHTTHIYMAKFLAELLGCTLPEKGASPMFECRSQPHIGLRHVTKQRPTIFGTLIEKPLGDHNAVSKHSLFILTILLFGEKNV